MYFPLEHNETFHSLLARNIYRNTKISLEKLLNSLPLQNDGDFLSSAPQLCRKNIKISQFTDMTIAYCINQNVIILKNSKVKGNLPVFPYTHKPCK